MEQKVRRDGNRNSDRCKTQKNVTNADEKIDSLLLGWLVALRFGLLYDLSRKPVAVFRRRFIDPAQRVLIHFVLTARVPDIVRSTDGR